MSALRRRGARASCPAKAAILMDLSYLNARLRGWKGRLLPGSDFKGFIASDGMPAFLDLLRGSDYGPDIDVATAAELTGYELLDSALRSNLSRTYRNLWALATEDALMARPLLKAVLSAWESAALKSILRGIKNNMPREVIIDSIVPAGEFDYGALKELIYSKDIEDLSALLTSWSSPYAAPVSAGLRALKESGTLFEMEIEIDTFVHRYYQQTVSGRSADAAVVAEVLTDRVDASNLLTLFKLTGEGYGAEAAGRFFMGGGRRLSLKSFTELAGTHRVEDLLGFLPDAVKDPKWTNLLLNTIEDDTVVIEDRFEVLIGSELMKKAVRDPLTIALAAAYLYCKVREIKNLRLVARAMVYSIPAGEIDRYIVYC